MILGMGGFVANWQVVSSETNAGWPLAYLRVWVGCGIEIYDFYWQVVSSACYEVKVFAA